MYDFNTMELEEILDEIASVTEQLKEVWHRKNEEANG